MITCLLLTGLPALSKNLSVVGVVKTRYVVGSLGIEKGTHVGVYMGMVPELPVTMLALARIGARVDARALVLPFLPAG